MSSWTEAGAEQVALPYPYYIDIVTKRYFDGVDNKNMEQVLGCFTEDAILTEVTSNTVHTGRAAVGTMFARLFSDLCIRQIRSLIRSARSLPCSLRPMAAPSFAMKTATAFILRATSFTAFMSI
jgi:hypothetical protein